MQLPLALSWIILWGNAAVLSSAHSRSPVERSTWQSIFVHLNIPDEKSKATQILDPMYETCFSLESYVIFLSPVPLSFPSAFKWHLWSGSIFTLVLGIQCILSTWQHIPLSSRKFSWFVSLINFSPPFSLFSPSETPIIVMRCPGLLKMITSGNGKRIAVK